MTEKERQWVTDKERHSELHRVRQWMRTKEKENDGQTDRQTKWEGQKVERSLTVFYLDETCVQYRLLIDSDIDPNPMLDSIAKSNKQNPYMLITSWQNRMCGYGMCVPQGLNSITHKSVCASKISSQNPPFIRIGRGSLILLSFPFSSFFSF